MSSMGSELDQCEDGARTVELSTGSNFSASGKLFVGGVSLRTSEDAVIIPNKHSRKPRGFGFVTFANPADADKVLEQEDHVINDRKVDVKRALPAGNNQIFVGGLPQLLTSDELGGYFSEYGVVDSRIIPDHKSGRSRCFGFVTFENEDAVQQILSKGKMQEIGGKKVEVKRVEPKMGGNKYSNNDFAGGQYQYSSEMPQQVYTYDAYSNFRNYAGISGYGGYLFGIGYGTYLPYPPMMHDCVGLGGAYYGVYCSCGGTSAYGCCNISGNACGNPRSSY
ncbi:uncharacterized protein LOC133794483 isoform X3 [Humulus lupulus]|uniref:uncharacterized protein LOC133794483 isoform X3 n=1 Tax=Humulus lupulus TaxID=3486 RepID=UPI002B40C0BB|nr:uncharacterized protein LOC133794483 isoform X3 [Humulus lupulus]